MAQLKDLVVTGPTRLVGDAYGKISSATTVPVVNNNTTLSFGGQRTIASIGGQNVTVVMPSGGAQGPQGPKGNQGPRGTDATGSQGRQGPLGSNGDDGSNIYFATAGSVDQGRLSTGYVAVADGVRSPEVGDLVIDVLGKGAIITRIQSGHYWFDDGYVDFRGVQGHQGPQGPKGTDATGSQGRQGPKGTDATGSQGRQGPQGPKGDQGPLNTAGQITVYNGNNSSTYYYLMGATGTTTGVTSNVYRAGTSTTSGVYWKNFDLYASSDERLKNIIEDIYPDLDRLRTIPKVFYRWKKEDADSKPHVGTSAQRLRDVYPELVDEGEDGLLSVAYDRLSIIALAAIDKLHEENEELKKEIETIKEKIRKMEGGI